MTEGCPDWSQHAGRFHLSVTKTSDHLGGHRLQCDLKMYGFRSTYPNIHLCMNASLQWNFFWCESVPKGVSAKEFKIDFSDNQQTKAWRRRMTPARDSRETRITYVCGFNKNFRSIFTQTWQGWARYIGRPKKSMYQHHVSDIQKKKKKHKHLIELYLSHVLFI